MSVTVAELVAKLKADTTDYDQGMKNATGKLSAFGASADDVAQRARRFGTGLSVGVTTPLVLMGKVATDAASDLDESMSKVGVVFGERSADIRKFAEGAATHLGMSRQAALEAAGTFGNLFTALGLGVNEAAALSPQLVQLAADLASFNNIDPGVALEKLRAGLVGEVEPLRTLGVSLSAAAVEAKAMQMGLGGNTGELTEASKVQARFALIMEQTANAQGDFARTADGYANSQRVAAAKTRDAAAAAGEKLQPAMLALQQSVGAVVTAFAALPSGLQTGIVAFLALAAAMGPVLTLGGAVVPAVVAVVVAIGAIPIAIGLAVAAIAAGLVYAYTRFEWFRAVVDAVVQAIVLVVQTYLTILLAFWKTTWTVFSAVVTTAWEVVGAVVETAMALVRALVETGMGIVRGYWNSTWGELIATVNDAWAVIAPAVAAAMGVVEGVITTVMGTVKNVWGGAWKAITTLAQGAWDTIAGGLNAFKNAIATIGGTIWKPLQTGFEAVVKAIKAAWNAVANIINSVGDVPIIGAAIPHIPTFHAGGIVPGPVGQERLVMAQGGERVLTPGQYDRLASAPVQGGPTNITINLDGREIARYIWSEHGMTSQMARAN